MQDFNLITIPEEIRQEFSVEQDGKTYASRRATARLCGLKDHKTIGNLLKSLVGQNDLSNPLQPFAGQDFQGGDFLPDFLVSAIISHYALKGRKEATECLVAFAAIGIRTWIQQELDWQPLLSVSTESDDIRDLQSKFFRLEMRIESCIDYFPWEYGERITSLEKKLEIQEQEIIELKSEYSWFKKDYDRLKEENDNLVRQREYRQKLNKLVAKYTGDDDARRKAVWTDLYWQFTARTGFDVYAAAKLWNCSCLDAVEIQRLMKDLYEIASKFVLYSKQL